MPEPSTEGYSQSWLEYEKVLGARPVFTGTAQEIIDQFNGLGALLAAQAPPPDASIITEDTVADGVPVRVFTPPGATGKKLPVGVYYHGGGWLVGSIDSEDAWCRVISKNTPCILISVGYRLSQTAKWPAQLDDALIAFKWARNNASKFGGDGSKLFTIGTSAGGGLALSVANELIKAGSGSQIQGIVAMVPVTTHPDSVPSAYQSQYKAWTENGSGVPVIDAGTMKKFFDAADIKAGDEKAFVTLSKNLKDFPPTYISTCGKDPLRDDGKIIEEMLKKEGVQTKSDFYEGLPHGFWLYPGVERGEEFLLNASKGAKWVTSQ